MEDCWYKTPLNFLFIEMVLVVVIKSWPKSYMARVDYVRGEIE
jgi:hypothetical protein